MTPRVLMNLCLGLNNNSDPAALTTDRYGKVYLSGCNNVIVGDGGRVERCSGKSIFESLEGIHSLYTIPGSGYCWVKNGGLFTSVNRNTGLSHNGKMSYARVDDRVFYSNGTDYGYIRAGLIYPSPAMPEYTGEKTPRVFTGMPAGHLVCWAAGRLLVARDNTVWMSERTSPLRFCLSDGRFTYRTRIRMMAGTESGFWVSDEEGIYYASYSGGAWRQEKRAPFPAYEGEPSQIHIGELPLDNIFGTGYLCPTVNGICLLGPDGIFVNLTDKVLELRNQEDGTPLSLTWFTGIVDRNRYYVSLWGNVKMGLCLNLKNLSVTQQDVFLNKGICRYGDKVLGAFTDGIYSLFEFWPRVDADFAFYADTGRLCRMRFLHLHGEFSGDIEVRLVCDETTERIYTGKIRREGNVQHEFKIPVARDNGIGTYWKIEIRNLNGRQFAVNRITADVIYRR